MGLVSASDGFNFSFTKSEQEQKIRDILVMEEHPWRQKYKRLKDAQSWKYDWAKKDAIEHQSSEITQISYRPFDTRFSLYTGNSGGLYARPMHEVMRNFRQPNLAICSTKRRRNDANCYFLSKYITDKSISSSLDNSYVFPLYLYPEVDSQHLIESKEERKPNLNSEILKKISESVGLSFTPEKEITKNTYAPIDLLDYIYAVLHSPTYLENYKEFLNVDFPKLPYPKNKKTFWSLVRLGKELRKIHLLEGSEVEQYITQYPIDGDNLVRELKYTDDKVYINDTQYFDSVPKVAWELYIGGYQPAQKWLKDRKNRILEFDEILHYQKIIKALARTSELMIEIDKIDI